MPRKIKRREYYVSIKLQAIKSFGGKCMDCGYTSEYIEVFDFHHLEPKEKYQRLSQLIGRGYSLKKIEKELSKCIMLCANCHRIREAIISKETKRVQ